MSNKQKFIDRAIQTTNKLKELHWREDDKYDTEIIPVEKEAKFVDDIIYDSNRSIRRKTIALKKKETSRAKVKKRKKYLKKIGIIKK